MDDAPQNQTKIKKSKRGGARAGAGRPANAVAFHAHEGAVQSTQRGYIYMPTLQPRKELQAGHRRELIKKSRWLVNNVGFPARARDAISRYACGTGITPQARTSNPDFNAAAEALFEDTVGTTAFAFDAAAEVNFYEAQSMILREMITDGGLFGQFLKTESGSAMMRFIGAEKIASPTGLPGDWIDGIRIDPMGRPRDYRVLTGDDMETGTVVPAADMLHFRRVVRRGYLHQPPWTSGIINHMQDISEITAHVKQSFKNAAQIGYLITSPEASSIGMGRTVTKTRDANGNPITTTDLTNGSIIPQLKPGEKIESFKNEQPGDQFDPLIKYLCRDMAWFIGLSSEILWDISNIGGANTRFVLQDAAVFFNELRAMLINQFCRPFWKYWLWHEMERGSLPAAPADWWRVDFIPPKDPTVDIGRDGKLYADLVDRGLLTARRYFAMQGLDIETEELDIVATAARRHQLAEEAAAKTPGLSPASIFPASTYTSPTTVVSPDPTV